MAKAMKDPSKTTEKQIRNVRNATEDIVAGVNAVTVAPTKLAADQLDKAKANYIKAIDSGKTRRNLLAVGVEDWRERMLAKVGNIATGIEASKSVIEEFHRQRNEVQKAINNELDKMPTKSLADSQRRMIAQMNGMAKMVFDKSKAYRGQ